MKQPATIKTAFLLLLCLTILTGIIYPALITGVSYLFFSKNCTGRLLYRNTQLVGSEWIGQAFTTPNYFWARPSATPAFPYNALSSGGSNLAYNNSQLIAFIKARKEMLKSHHNTEEAPPPIDLLTYSASGLDPHISPAAAFYQVERVAKIRGLPKKQIEALVKQFIEKRQWGVFGEPRVNVLKLNLALDEQKR